MGSILRARQRDCGTARRLRRATGCDLRFRSASMFRYITFFMLALAAVLIISIDGGATRGQSNAGDGERLVESGKADKIIKPATSDQLKIVSYNIRWRSAEELQQIVH